MKVTANNSLRARRPLRAAARAQTMSLGTPWGLTSISRLSSGLSLKSPDRSWLPSDLQFQVNHIAPRESQLVEKAQHIPVTPVDQRVDFCHADLLHVRDQLFHKRAGDAVMLVFRVDADRINPPDSLRHAVLPAP